MALATAAAVSTPSRATRHLPSSPASRPPSSLLPLAPRRGGRNSPRACSWHRLVVRRQTRARALLGGFSDAGASESDDDEEEHALRGGRREGEVKDDVELAAATVGPERWDVLGLGQAMVDFSGMVDDEFLERLSIEKGTRKVINHEERGRVLRAMDGCSYKAAAGGSLSNSLVALARLGSNQSAGLPELKIAMAGSVGSDPLGSFYRQKLRRANVHFLSKPVKDGTTGTVIVLTTPDAQRTMLAYQGTSSTLSYDSDLAHLVSKSNVLIVEGYLFELPHTIETIKRACEDAHKNGALIAVTASDVSCIKRCYNDFSPLFVTWKKAANGSEPRLRGCIGTLEPRQIVSGFKDYALTSALRDRRFPPIQSKELPTLECTVSILTDYETAGDYLDWEVGKHGLIIEFTDPDYNMRRSATYLPEVAGHEGWTHEETIDSLMRKAGYQGAITESLRKKIRVTRYQSTLYTMHYGEYVAYLKKNRGAAPSMNGVPVVNGFKPGH